MKELKVCVLGPHGSGNRLNGRMLEACPDVKTCGVLSYPGLMPPIKNYDTSDFFILSIRDPEMVASSMLKEGQVRDIETGRQWAHDGMEQVWGFLGTIRDEQFITVTYERTVNDGAKTAIEDMAKMMGVPPWPFDEEIYDGNIKYIHDVDCDMGDDCSCGVAEVLG